MIIMDNKIPYEKILIVIAIILCAFIIGYNAFFVPKINIPAVVYVDNSNKNESENYDLEESGDKSSVNINTASADEIEKALDGVGPTIAQRIVDYRENVSEFKSKQDIKNVKVIFEDFFLIKKNSNKNISKALIRNIIKAFELKFLS